MDKLNILIPISGAGTRFKNTHKDPKPLIPVNGMRMIELVLKNINYKNANYIFIVKQEHLDNYNLKEILEKNTINPTIISVNSTTEGAACSALLAKDYINNESPLFIINGDQYVEMNFQEYFEYNIKENFDGSIVCFEKHNDPKWSYIRLNDLGNIIDVAEKKPISNIATAGLYWWKHGRLFVESSNEMIINNDKTNNEYYIAPTYNYLKNKIVKPFIIDTNKFHGLGIPEDLKKFENSNFSWI